MKSNCEHKKTFEKYLCDEETGEVKKIGVYCEECGKWLKWRSFIDDEHFIMPFGKYKGHKIIDIVKKDRGYANWAISKFTGSLRDRFIRMY